MVETLRHDIINFYWMPYYIFYLLSCIVKDFRTVTELFSILLYFWSTQQIYKPAANLSDHTINATVAKHKTSQNTESWITPTFRNIKTLVREAIIFRDCCMYQAIQPIGIFFNHLSCHIRKFQKVLTKTTSSYRFSGSTQQIPTYFPRGQ